MGLIKDLIMDCACKYVAANPKLTFEEAWDWASSQTIEFLLMYKKGENNGEQEESFEQEQEVES